MSILTNIVWIDCLWFGSVGFKSKILCLLCAQMRIRNIRYDGVLCLRPYKFVCRYLCRKYRRTGSFDIARFICDKKLTFRIVHICRRKGKKEKEREKSIHTFIDACMFERINHSHKLWNISFCIATEFFIIFHKLMVARALCWCSSGVACERGFDCLLLMLG